MKEEKIGIVLFGIAWYIALVSMGGSTELIRSCCPYDLRIVSDEGQIERLLVEGRDYFCNCPLSKEVDIRFSDDIHTSSERVILYYNYSKDVGQWLNRDTWRNNNWGLR